jgi:hypothetical protein
MAKRTNIPRRHFLVGSGVVLAHTAIAGRTARAGSAKPPEPPGLSIAPAKQPAAHIIESKPGAAPGYIISGRGQDDSNPYFRPLGGPSNQRTPKPPEAHGKGVDDDDQGENQQ